MRRSNRSPLLRQLVNRSLSVIERLAMSVWAMSAWCVEWVRGQGHVPRKLRSADALVLLDYCKWLQTSQWTDVICYRWNASENAVLRVI